MAIEKGEDWGRPFHGDADIVHAAGDADLAAKAYAAQLTGGQDRFFTVERGDVVASLGFTEPDFGHHDIEPLLYPMDLGVLEVSTTPGSGGATIPFVAHVIARHRRWEWPEFVAMNTPLAGAERLGPRAHPNDGKIDITTGRLPLRQAAEARRRAVSGTHVPHPNLTVVRRSEFVFTAGRPLTVLADGQEHGRWQSFTVTLIPDAFNLVLPRPG